MKILYEVEHNPAQIVPVPVRRAGAKFVHILGMDTAIERDCCYLYNTPKEAREVTLGRWRGILAHRIALVRDAERRIAELEALSETADMSLAIRCADARISEARGKYSDAERALYAALADREKVARLIDKA